MIVDDKYVIIGSANIYQRSMTGSKDAKIAVEVYQPHYALARKQKHPRGQIYGYRKSLWLEHLDMLDHHFEEPENLECVRMINHIAEENWKKYATPEFTPLQGHPLRYPLLVDRDRKVSSQPDRDGFPDAGGKILGTHSMGLPDALTAKSPPSFSSIEDPWRKNINTLIQHFGCPDERSLYIVIRLISSSSYFNNQRFSL